MMKAKTKATKSKPRKKGTTKTIETYRIFVFDKDNRMKNKTISASEKNKFSSRFNGKIIYENEFNQWKESLKK